MLRGRLKPISDTIEIPSWLSPLSLGLRAVLIPKRGLVLPSTGGSPAEELEQGRWFSNICLNTLTLVIALPLFWGYQDHLPSSSLGLAQPVPAVGVLVSPRSMCRSQ